MVEEQFIGGEQEDARSTTDIGGGELSQCAGRLVRNRRSERSFSYGVRDVARRRHYTSTFAHFRLTNDADSPALDGDYLAEKQLINFAENFRFDHGERVWALGVIKFGDNFVERGIADADAQRSVIEQTE